MGKFSGVLKGISIASSLKSIGSSLRSLLKGLSGKLVLKWGGISASIGGIFLGIYSGIKNIVSTVSDGGTSAVKSVVETFTGIELSDSQAMMIFAGGMCIAIILIVFYLRRKKSR